MNHLTPTYNTWVIISNKRRLIGSTALIGSAKKIDADKLTRATPRERLSA